MINRPRTSPRLDWLEHLGRVHTWSAPGFATSVVVATIVFVFGNIALFLTAPALLFASNTALTALAFGGVWAVARAVDGRLGRWAAGTVALAAVVVFSAARGVVLDLVIDAFVVDDGQSAMTRAIISVTVFGPGLILSVLTVRAVSQWRVDEARIKNATEQILATRQTIHHTIEAHIDDVTTSVRTQLGPRLTELSSLAPADARVALDDMVTTIVRPVSHALHDTAPVSAPPPRRTAGVAFMEFIQLALRDAPLAPVITGVFFSATLVPRYLPGEGLLRGLAITAAMGLGMWAGTWAINKLSRRLLQRVPTALHVAMIVIALLTLGSALGVLSNLLTGFDIGFDNVFIVGAAATLTLASLLGGVVNASRYFRQQQQLVTIRERELEAELTKARQLQWQRNSSLANWLHGPLQAAMNAAKIRLSRGSHNPQQLHEELVGIAHELESLLSDIDAADHTPTDVARVISRISAMWEAVTQLHWDVDHELIAALSHTPLARAIGDVLVEGVFNAIKHQSPQTIDISLHPDASGDIALTIRHPGRLATDATPGLGTSVYQELTTCYSLENVGDDVVLTVLFPGH